MNPRLRFYAIYLLPVALVVGVIVMLDIAGTDALVSGWFFDAHAGEFPWRHNGFLEVVMHHWTKYLVALAAVTAFAGYMISFLTPQLKPLRPSFLFVVLALALAPFAVVVMKFFSTRHCPWDVAGFGGIVPYVSLLESYPAGIAAGHCFPAGHASTGFCLFAFHFLGRALASPLLARAGFALGLAAGLSFGFVRIVQGAHFVSHVLWSGVVCWIVIVVLYDLIIEPHQTDRHLKPAGAAH
ncbi:MAG TPA: phosphatase PAP2 family protein [Burkholderiales bacterium]|nr:phosphatase PAP2 family protein [Burkholderiales bacterium]